MCRDVSGADHRPCGTLWADEIEDGVAIATNGWGLSMRQHWNVNGCWIGVHQPIHQLEEGCEKGNSMRKLRWGQNVVT